MQMFNINGLTYTARENPEWFTRAMFGGRLIQGGYIRVLTGIKGDELLSQIDLQNKILQIDGLDCAWTPNQIIKLSEKKATIKTYKINLEECIDTLENKRTVHMLQPGAHNDALPAELEDAALMLIAIGLSNEIEEMLIGGDSSVDPNQINGMVKTLKLSTESYQLVGVALTDANVLTKIGECYDVVPENVLQAEDAGTLYCFVSYATRRKARKALATVANDVVAANWTVDDTDKKNPRLFYLGMELVPVKGIPTHDIIILDGLNAYLLTDLLSDIESVELGQFPKPQESKVFIKGRLRLGFVIPFEDECVIMSTTISVAQSPNGPMDDLKVTPNSLVFSAAGETKTFVVTTKDTAATISISAKPDGFTSVTPGTTTAGVTTITVVAPANTGNTNPRTGEVDILIVGTDRRATVTLNQHAEEVINLT